MIAVLNLGLKSIRAAVFDLRGQRRAIAYRAIETMMGEGRVEQDPNLWWALAKQVLAEVLDASDVRDEVRVLTVTASAGCLVPMNENLEALGTAIMISDVRARSEAELISNLTVFAELAHRPARVTPDLMLPKILWMREHDPDRFHRTRWFATPNDFLVAKLTGEVVTDVHNASKYFYELETEGEYPARLLSTLQVDRSRLPTVFRQSPSLGLRQDVRDELGLHADCTVVISAYDAICAVYGAGVAVPGDACDVSGTVTSFRAVSELPLRDPSGRLFVVPHVQPNLYLAGGSNNLGGGVIEWAKQLLYSKEEKPYAAMERDAAEAPPGAGGIVFLPYLIGERAPIWDADARAVFFGLGRNHGRSDMLRAVFEGVGYSVLDIADRLSELGIGIGRVVASGGLAQVAPIRQIKADMLGVPVLMTEELETTALGAALLAGVAVGCFSSIEEATQVAVRFTAQVDPDPPRTEMYRDAFAMYRSLYEALRQQFRARRDFLVRHSEVLRTQPTYTENL